MPAAAEKETYADRVDIGALVAPVGFNPVGKSVSVRVDYPAPCDRNAVARNCTQAEDDSPANMADHLLDASRSAHLVVRLERFGRCNDDRRWLGRMLAER